MSLSDGFAGPFAHTSSIATRGAVCIPLRLPRADHLGGDPRREGLVEPEVVPPRHGDEISEPLVAELVRADARVPALPAGRVFVDAREDDLMAEGDQAGVLHR